MRNEQRPLTSAYGYKQTFHGVRQRVRFTPESRRSGANVRFPTDFVRFTPRSRPCSGAAPTAAYDPQQKSMTRDPYRLLVNDGLHAGAPRHSLPPAHKGRVMGKQIGTLRCLAEGREHGCCMEVGERDVWPDDEIRIVHE